MRALDRKLLRDLWRLKTQALAIAVVMAAGIGVFVMSLGTLDSLDETRRIYYERQRFAQVFAHVKRAPDSLLARIAALPGVSHAETRIVFDVTLDVPGLEEPATGRLISLPDLEPPLLNLPYPRRGRPIEPWRTDEVLASEAFAEAHGLKPGDRVGALINGRKRQLQIVGIALSPEYVYAMPPGGIIPDDRRFGVLWMSRRALEAATNLDGAFNDVSLTLMAGASEPEVIARIDGLLDPYGGVGAYGRADQPSDWYVSGELDQLRAMAIISPAIFLGVAAFLLHTVMSRLIATEREQIGTLKACGYSNLQVGMHYLKFTLAIVAVGILLGTVAGLLLGRDMTAMYARFYRFPVLVYELTPRVVLTAAIISAAVAVAGTYGAFRQAALLPPAEAMRPAPPAVYRRTLVERLGLQGLFAQPSRMILRHLERRPVRSLLSCLGIAAAVAVMIASLFSLDALDYIIDVQFQHADRQDVTVTFVEPRGQRALDEVAHLPGVLAAEPFRAVPVRLRAGHRVERLALQGLVTRPDLRRMIDAELRPVAVPDSGVMLSGKLAELLGVGPGDDVIAETLEGRRAVRTLSVAGVFEEYVGASAFMALPELNRIMQEGPTISGAQLLIDRAASAALYRRLKDTPGVAGVGLREEVIEVVRRTLAENILRIMLFNVFFAGLIAFGVVYNSARIALAERARDLATLRVLGLTRWEVGYILLGEMALLTLAAVPLGCLLGYALAWIITLGLDTELYRIPLVIERSTYGWAVVVVATAALLSGLVVRRRLDRLDLVAVLKTRD